MRWRVERAVSATVDIFNFANARADLCCDRGRRVVSRRCTPDVACISRALYIYYFRADAAGLDEARGSGRESERRRFDRHSIDSLLLARVRNISIVCRECRVLYISSFVFLFFFFSPPFVDYILPAFSAYFVPSVFLYFSAVSRVLSRRDSFTLLPREDMRVYARE